MSHSNSTIFECKKCKEIYCYVCEEPCSYNLCGDCFNSSSKEEQDLEWMDEFEWSEKVQS